MTNNKIKNIFFDFNGTILDDLDLSYELLVEMMNNVHLKPISLERYLEVFDFPVKDYYEKIGFDFTTNSFHDGALYFINEYNKRWETKAKLYPMCKETLKKLKEEGYKIYILSASEINLLKSQLKYYGIIEYFDDIVASDNPHAIGKVEYGKEYILKHNINMNESIMIGDTVHDYKVAKEIGLSNVLLFTKGHNSISRLKPLADTIDSYNGIYNYINKLK